MKKQEQTKAKRKLKRNFFREAMTRELNLEYRRQLSESIKRGIQRKKLSTLGKVAM
jgi:hypothetical protein